MCISQKQALSETLIKIAGEKYVNSGHLSQEVLHSLFLVHGKVLQAALEIIDNKKVRSKYFSFK